MLARRACHVVLPNSVEALQPKYLFYFIVDISSLLEEWSLYTKRSVKSTSRTYAESDGVMMAVTTLERKSCHAPR